jgi:SRSO17 transposase
MHAMEWLQLVRILGGPPVGESVKMAPPERVRRLQAFGAAVLACLPRLDQRRAGEAYLRGLLGCDGRKSIRQIGGYVHECSAAALRQFVNRSPWEPAPVRERILRVLENSVRPTAWVLDEIMFPKNGRFSAAVERQYAHPTARLCNCQLATVVGLATADACLPVNWRLVLPESWDADELRRSRARVPADEQSRPSWRYQLEMLDEMSQEWGMAAAPVVVDARSVKGAGSLLTALEARNLGYVAQIRAATPVRPEPGGRGSGPVAVSRLLTSRGQAERQTVSWDEGPLRVRRTQFVSLRVPGADETGYRLLLAEWPLGRHQPTGYWLTNIADLSIGELSALARLREPARHRLTKLAGDAGLFDYEGRSFLGWHHHVTLVSAACAFLATAEAAWTGLPRPEFET